MVNNLSQELRSRQEIIQTQDPRRRTVFLLPNTKVPFALEYLCYPKVYRYMKESRYIRLLQKLTFRGDTRLRLILHHHHGFLKTRFISRERPR